MKRVLVIAPSKRTFIQEMDQRTVSTEEKCTVNWTQGIVWIGDVEYRYIDSPRRLRGFHGVQVEFLNPHMIDPIELEEYKRESMVATSVRAT